MQCVTVKVPPTLLQQRRMIRFCIFILFARISFHQEQDTLDICNNRSSTSLPIGAVIVLLAAFIDWKDTRHQHT